MSTGCPCENGGDRIDTKNVSATNGSMNIIGKVTNVNFPMPGQKTVAEHIKEARDSVFLTDPQIDRETLITTKGERTKGTCEWIRNNDTYTTWLQDENSVLWISGGPGKGKTFLSIFLSQELDDRRKVKGGHTISYFCTSLDEKRNTSVAILRGLVWQLMKLVRSKDQESWLDYFEGESRKQATISDPEALWAVLEELLHTPDLGKVFCVLDGLDECSDESKTFLIRKCRTRLKNETLQGTSCCKVLKLAIVSRKVHGLEVFPTLSLDSDHSSHIEGDIDRFISARLADLTGVVDFDDDARSKIEKKLKKKAEGTFLWVGFVVDELSRKERLTDVEEALESMPPGLDRIFDRMLSQIDPKKRRKSALILRWVALALRPLSLLELARAIEIRSQSPKGTIRAIQDAIHACGPFIRITDDLVSLVHQAAKDYFLHEHPAPNQILVEFRIDEKNAQCQMTETCLQEIEKSPLLGSPSKEVVESCLQDRKKYPLAGYAVAHWTDHARQSSSLAIKFCHDSRRLFDKKFNTDAAQGWRQAHFQAKGYACPEPFLHMACHFGILPFVDIALESSRHWFTSVFKPWKKSIDDADNRFKNSGTTPIPYAIDGGHYSVVKRLIELGADVSWTASMPAGDGSKVCSPLERAIEKKYWNIVRLLLDAGFDVNPRDSSRWETCTPLVAAIDGGNTDLAQKLLGRGAKINPTPITHWREYRASNVPLASTPLAAAIGARDTALVESLLSKGAELVPRARVHNTPLMAAVQVGDEARVQQILDLGASANDADCNKTCLMTTNDKTIASLLLEHGADPNCVAESSDRTALMYAAQRGNNSIVQLLLDHGANIHAESEMYSTALRCAAEAGHETTARLLLEHGSDPNRPHISGTPLGGVIVKGDVNMARLLCKHGANTTQLVHATQKASEPLVWVISYKRTVIVQFLLEYGVDPNKPYNAGNCHATPLASAIITEQVSITRLLLEHGADANLPVSLSGGVVAPLKLAASLGFADIVQMLIGHGADVNHAVNGRDTALCTAVRMNRENIVRLLMDLGADHDSINNGLLAAASLGRTDIAQLLLEAGADKDHKAWSGETALALAIEGGHDGVKNLLIEMGACQSLDLS